MQEALQRAIEHREIFHDEMLSLMRKIMSGEATPVMIAAFTVGLRVKKETVGEIAAAAQVMREFATKVDVPDRDQLVDIVTGCTRQHVDIKIFPDIFELMAREVETSELTGLPLMRVRDVALRGWMRFLKRAMDIAVSWSLPASPRPASASCSRPAITAR
jgi:hypothetical protein